MPGATGTTWSSTPAIWPAPAAVIARLRAAGCVFAEEEARLLIAESGTPADLAAKVNQRAAGAPLEYVLGWAEFCGLRVAVDPGVFVPRRRTELLVRQATALAGQALDIAHDPGRRAVVVDLCCGSGAVGAALAAVLGRVELHAVDIDPAAASCACRNVVAFAGRVYQGDLYEPLPDGLRGRVDVCVANAPYVPTDAVPLLPPEAREYEPRAALDGGPDGLDVLRRVIADASGWLAPGGYLLVEISKQQAEPTVQMVARHGLIPRLVTSEKLNATVVIGRRRPPRAHVATPLSRPAPPRPRAPRGEQDADFPGHAGRAAPS